MPTFSFAAKAERDLERIVDFTITRWGAAQATRYLDELQERCELLANNPDAGLLRDDVARGILSFPYESHVLYYTKRRHGITVVRVLHQSMDAVRHL